MDGSGLKPHLLALAVLWLVVAAAGVASGWKGGEDAIRDANSTRGRALLGAVLKQCKDEVVDDATVLTREAAKRHTDDVGVSLPHSAFAKALAAAAVVIEHGGERRKWALLTMTDLRVVQLLLPHTLQALHGVPVTQGLAEAGASAHPNPDAPTDAAETRVVSSRSSTRSLPCDTPVESRTFSSMLVAMAWSESAVNRCEKLRMQYGHQCVWDASHEVPTGEGFHSPGFNAMGFAKIKYIYNALSLGYDVFSMDADVVVLRSPLPAVLAMQRPQLAALAEKCEVVDPGLQIQPREVRKPQNNIGVLFVRADGPAIRCMERWFGDMVAKVNNPRLWDQEEFDKVMAHCAPRLNMRWHMLDNRQFVSMCQPACGCNYPDDDRRHLSQLPVTLARRRRAVELLKRHGNPFDASDGRSCGPQHWSNWTLVHFPCQGSPQDKEKYMAALLEGVRTGTPQVLKNFDRVV